MKSDCYKFQTKKIGDFFNQEQYKPEIITDKHCCYIKLK